MSDVEIIDLGEFDPSTNKRSFDAVSYETCFWRGLLSFEGMGKDTKVVVYSDREDLLGDDYAVKPGTLKEVVDPERAKVLIAKAITSCFDHSVTQEALPDGRGGWIRLETDT